MARPLSSSQLNAIKLAMSGEKNSIRTVVESTQTEVYRFCFYLCKSQEQAEDLCQETYLKALGNLKNLEKPEVFMSWICKIAKNLFLDIVRSKDYETSQNDLAKTQEASADSNQGLAIDIQKALSHFEPEDRALLVLVDMEENSYSEAGQILGISESAVKSRLFRLRQEFLKIWQKSETK